MSLTLMSPLAWLLGAFLLAGGLLLLQRLRERYKALPVANMVLWQQALQSSQVRSLWHRFRHWLTYLFILVIALLLWLLAAAPQWSVNDQQALKLYYLDASAYMTAGNRFAEAKHQLLADIEQQPAANRRVLLGDLETRLLLREDEQSALLPARLETVRAQLQPSRFSAWLRQIQQQNPQRPLRVFYYGYPTQAPLSVPTTTLLQVVVAHASAPLTNNQGITSFGKQITADGKHIRVYLEVAQSDPTVTAPRLQWFLDERPYQPQRIQQLATTEPGLLRYELVIPRSLGSHLRVRLITNDNFRGDDHASLTMTDSTPLRIVLSEQAPKLFMRVLAADPGLQQVSDAEQADVAVRRSGEAKSDLPTWVIGAPTTTPSLSFASNSARTSVSSPETMLQQVFGFDVATLTQRLGQPPSLSWQPQNKSLYGQRQLLMSPDWLQQKSDIVDSATFPLLISRGLNWLANRQSLSYAKIAEQPTLPVNAQGELQLKPFFTRTTGQKWQQQTLNPALLEMPLTALKTTATAEALAAVASDVDSVKPHRPLANYLLLLVLLLLAVEWLAVQRGWIP
ncbi:hypothetical protein NJR55_01855 [Idiomarina sp. M1R2S28]|uniref:Aerotolerance regulator N-terminal domain-containing protein n=1 Tax=Idiomarina rhizosphaerae TaxID=2961572 RepID=A0A9X2JTT3_9GAMM|nr:hypothetical protein [Idiomarina rhizosphaerae]MCP1338326.1 hypothetical protein [Idiomarina rhizosphaerae]